MDEHTTHQTKNQKNIIIIIVVVAVLLISALYWFVYRPAHIRSSCDKRARDFAKIGDTKTFSSAKYNPTYSACLHQHGL
jgi:flagellar basal body-associated protein FliL